MSDHRGTGVVFDEIAALNAILYEIDTDFMPRTNRSYISWWMRDLFKFKPGKPRYKRRDFVKN